MAVGGTPTWLGDQNAALALEILLDHGPQSRAGLAKLSGLSKQTAAQLITRLEERGLVEPVGESSASRGPSATVYGARTDLGYGVAINIDQVNVESTVVDVTGTEHPVAREPADPMDGSRTAARDVAAAVLRACEAAKIDLDRVRQVCVGLPCSVDTRSDELSSVEALPGWSRRLVRQQVGAALGCDVVIDNDVNLAAVAERRTGRFAPEAIVAVIWIGHGIGLAVDVAGTVMQGATGGAGEIGHLPVPRGTAGATADDTDLEDLIGSSALERMARELGEPDYTFERVLAGVPLPARLAEGLAPRIALAVLPVLGVIDPDEVVLSGPVATAGGPRLAELVRGNIRNHTRWDPSIGITRLAAEVVLAGARAVCGRQLRRDVLSAVQSTAAAEDSSRAIAGRLRTIK